MFDQASYPRQLYQKTLITEMRITSAMKNFLLKQKKSSSELTPLPAVYNIPQNGSEKSHSRTTVRGREIGSGQTFRKTIWPFLTIGQMFGLMPAIGVGSDSVTDLRFKWISFRTIYSICVASISFLYAMRFTVHTFSGTITLSSIAHFFYYVSNAYAYVSFIALASKWPELMRYWEIAGSKLPTFRNREQRKSFMIRTRIIAFTVFLLESVQHVMGLISIYQVTKRTDAEDSFSRAFPRAIKWMMSSMFADDYEIPIYFAIFAQFMFEIAVFSWSYLNVFIMMISIGLSTQFKLLNMELKEARQNQSLSFWALKRVQYEQMCELITFVDKRISHITFFSYADNLFCICQKLFTGFSPSDLGLLRVIYSRYGLIVNITRTYAVSLLAARVNDESRKLSRILRSIPSHSWNCELERLYNEVVHSCVALSGMEFFYITRRFILAMTGTVITYELVLMQFHN